MKNSNTHNLSKKDKNSRIVTLKNQIKQLKDNNNPKDDTKIKNCEEELYKLENIDQTKVVHINSKKDPKENIKQPLSIKNNKINKSNFEIKQLAKNNQLSKKENHDSIKFKTIENQNNEINNLKKQISKSKTIETQKNELINNLKKEINTSNSKIKELIKNNELLKKENPNSIKSKTIETQKNELINNLKKEINTSNSKIKELIKNNELLKKENPNSIKSKTIENQKNEINNLKKEIDHLNLFIDKQELLIKNLSKINLKILNSLKKNFKFFLYWNFLESNYELKKDDLISEKIEVSKERFFLSLREFLKVYKTTLNIEDNRFDVIKRVVQSTLKSTTCNQKDLILSLHKLAHLSGFFILKERDKSFIKELFTTKNYLLFFPNTDERKINFKENYYEVLRSYYVAPTSSIILLPLSKRKQNLKN